VKTLPKVAIKMALHDFCVAHRIASNSVALFATNKNGIVELKEIGQRGKAKGANSYPDMENLIIKETDGYAAMHESAIGGEEGISSRTTN
jgi:hypothetical protein